ncbi:MAG TPA: ATP-dependent Clp protease proteolytic subunit, partial [Telluria sp.]|nr:ATP-dependent Clp protease proteolytic subunit [Telluria sp.]
MALHIVHFIGPINQNSVCTVRNLCLQALQSGASEIELHMSTEGGNMTAGFALYFFLKSLPLPLTTHNIGSVESVGVPIFL